MDTLLVVKKKKRWLTRKIIIRIPPEDPLSPNNY